ncbi:MAG: hypothetical protein ACLFUJ_16845 [Phycisphaerae bacterium]
MIVPGLYVFFLLHAFFGSRRRAHALVTAGAVFLLAVGLVISGLVVA